MSPGREEVSCLVPPGGSSTRGEADVMIGSLESLDAVDISINEGGVLYFESLGKSGKIFVVVLVFSFSGSFSFSIVLLSLFWSLFLSSLVFLESFWS